MLVWHTQLADLCLTWVTYCLSTEVISEELYESLVEWNLDEKVSTVTLDNCITNDAIIPLFVRKIGKSKLISDGKVLHMRCCAHILNLIVKG
uniref:Uncharacterized protein n=1 Tax=Arundo donax TaxID=35708 RepID=A0A0A9E398_ARUDO